MTDLPNWVYDTVMAMQHWEFMHPVLYQIMPDGQFVPVDACGCAALALVPDEVKAHAAMLTGYLAKLPPVPLAADEAFYAHDAHCNTIHQPGPDPCPPARAVECLICGDFVVAGRCPACGLVASP